MLSWQNNSLQFMEFKTLGTTGVIGFSDLSIRLVTGHGRSQVLLDQFVRNYSFSRVTIRDEKTVDAMLDEATWEMQETMVRILNPPLVILSHVALSPLAHCCPQQTK